MPTFNSGRACSIGGFNIRKRRDSDLVGIRFADNRDTPTSANDLVLYRRSSGLYFWNGSVEYNILASAAGSVGDLNGVYENGSAVNIDEGPIVLTDATAAALDILRIIKSGAGSGDSLEFLHTAAATGRAIYLDMDLAIARTGILIDSGATARTGADIQFTDDSTGTHSVIDINSSGSGASTGLDWTDSYLGSDASFGVLLTLDDDDGIDATAMRIVRGAGVRTVPAIDINEGSTGSADIIDVDVASVFPANVIDVAYAGAATGNTIFINLDNAVAATALHIEGSGVRTQPMVEIASDATGALSLVEIVLTGAISGHIFEISMDTTSTGDVLNVDMNAAVGGRFLFLDAGAGARTANMIDVTYDSTGNLDFCEITNTNTGSGHLFDININGAASGNVIDIVYGATLNTGDAVSINLGATAVGAQAIVVTSGVMIRTTDLIGINENGAASGDTIDVAVGSVLFTGDVLKIDLGATAVGAQAMVVASGAMIRTTALFQITDSGASTGAIFDLNRAAANEGIMFDIDDSVTASTGNVFDYASAVASTGTIFNVNMTNAVGAIINNWTIAGVRTANGTTITHTASGAVDIFQIDDSGTSSGHVFDINSSGNSTGNVIDIVASGTKVAGHFLNLSLATDVAGAAIVITGAGARTEDYIQVNDSSTSNSQVFDIDISGNSTANVLDIVMSGTKVAGHAIHTDMGTDLAGNALLIDAAGVRTAPLIYIANTATDAGTDDHVIYINQTGLLDSNLIQLTFGTAASTGDALAIAMGTNVAGMAVSVISAGTGVSGEGCAFDVAHTGALVAGADVVTIHSTGNISSTSNLLAIEQDTGAGTAGAYGLYINCTGANVEAIRVDAGNVVFDETLTVVGAGTFSSTLGVTGQFNANAAVVFAGTEDIAAGGTSTALSLTVSQHTIASDVGGDIFTLANGTNGQITTILCKGADGVSTITPATFAQGTSITFNAIGDSVTLQYATTTGWFIIGGNSYTIV